MMSTHKPYPKTYVRKCWHTASQDYLWLVVYPDGCRTFHREWSLALREAVRSRYAHRIWI